MRSKKIKTGLKMSGMWLKQPSDINFKEGYFFGKMVGN